MTLQAEYKEYQEYMILQWLTEFLIPDLKLFMCNCKKLKREEIKTNNILKNDEQNIFFSLIIKFWGSE